MATGLQTRHGNILQEAFKNGLQSFVNTTTNTLAATSTTGTPAAGTFYSTVVGRASVVDISQDLKASFGIERIMTQQIVQLQNEFGPNGEPVFSAVNDDRGLIRFVGASWVQNSNSYGFYAASNTANEYAEITFYGTGLNILGGLDIGRDLRASVDGGAETSSTIFPIANGGQALAARNYTPNMVYQVVSGLALGVHTAKIRINAATNNSLSLSGFEILNNASTTSLNVNPGIAYVDGLKIVSSAAQSISYNSSFETGTLGTRGGHVVTYLKQDGTVGKAVTPVNAASAFLTSADHTNEEIVRTYNWREFGAGRGDDFSIYNGINATLAFVLDDGITSLQASSVSPVGANSVYTYNNAGFITFTFIGSGVDFIRVDDANGGSDSYSIFVDGIAVGNLSSTGSLIARKVTLASGLPYGCHTVKILRNTALTFNVGAKQFIVYQPKKPAVPLGAVELADYNIVANYVANTSAGLDTIAQGVIRKNSSREFVYADGTGGGVNWSISAPGPTSVVGSFEANSSNLGAYVEYTFFGTGFDLRFAANTNRSSNITVTVDGLPLTVANFPALVTSVYGAGSYVAPQLNQNGASLNGAGFQASGLSLGLHKVRFNQSATSTASTYLVVHALDIITPVHSAKSNVSYDQQNTLPVGSNSLSDNRKTTAIKDAGLQKKNTAQALGLATGVSTSSTTYVPLPDMSVTIASTTGKLDISFGGNLTCATAGGYGDCAIFVDGVQASINQISQTSTAGYSSATTSIRTITQVSPGYHKIDVYWKSPSGATVFAYSDTNAGRSLSVVEI